MATIDELRARAELIAEETQIGGNTAERVGEAFDMVADIIEAVDPEENQAVLYNEQSPTTAQQAQARTNIDAQQTLTSGLNIKTIAGHSLLGSGDVELDNVEATQSASAQTTTISVNDTDYTIAVGAAPVDDSVKYTAPTWQAVNTALADKVNYTDLQTSVSASSSLPVQSQAIASAIAASANVQADWDTTNASNGSYIKNKPNIVENLAGSGSESTTLIKAGNNSTNGAYVRVDQSTAAISGNGGGVAISSNGVELTAGNSGYPNATVMYNGYEIAKKTEVNAVASIKANKASNPTNGDLAALDSSGNITDSGYKPADFQTALTFDDYPTDSSSNPVKSGGVYTMLTTKQDKMFVESVNGGTTLRAGLNYYHKITSEVNTLNIILPVPSSIVYLNNTKIEFTTGDSPAITFTSTGTVTTSLTFEANTHYLIECYYAVDEWVVNSVDSKQDIITDLSTIRSGASAGATAVQPATLATALAAKQNTLTFDTTPTASSTNPVTSGGIKTALDLKADSSTSYTQTEVDTLLSSKQNTLSFDNSPTDSSTNPVTSGGIYDALEGKQDALVSGSNIKTLNGESLIGSGDLTIEDGADGENAVNPFKGWFASLAALQDAYAAPEVGDYAFVVSGSTAAIYSCATAGTWANSGLTAETSNIQTFSTGEAVNETGIGSVEEGGTDLVTGGAVYDEIEKIAIINLDKEYPLSSGYYQCTNASGSNYAPSVIPSGRRKNGLLITFYTAAYTPAVYQFSGLASASASWLTVTRWTKITRYSDFTDNMLLSQGVINVTKDYGSSIGSGNYFQCTNASADYFAPSYVPAARRERGALLTIEVSQYNWKIYQFQSIIGGWTAANRWVEIGSGYNSMPYEVFETVTNSAYNNRSLTISSDVLFTDGATVLNIRLSGYSFYLYSLTSIIADGTTYSVTDISGNALTCQSMAQLDKYYKFLYKDGTFVLLNPDNFAELYPVKDSDYDFYAKGDLEVGFINSTNGQEGDLNTRLRTKQGRFYKSPLTVAAKDGYLINGYFAFGENGFVSYTASGQSSVEIGTDSYYYRFVFKKSNNGAFTSAEDVAIIKAAAETGGVTEVVSLDTVENMITIGTSHTEGNGCLKMKSFVPYLSALYDWNVVNLGISGCSYIQALYLFQNDTTFTTTNAKFGDINKGGICLDFLGGNAENVYFTEPYDAKYTVANMKRLYSVLRSYGYDVILGSYFGDQSNSIGVIQDRVAREMGLQVVQMNSECKRLNMQRTGVSGFSPYFYNNHFGTRTVANQFYPFWEAARIRRPRTAIKVFRNRATVSDNSELLYNNIFERIKIWREIDINHMSIDGHDEYVDRLDSFISDGLAQTRITSEYNTLKSGGTIAIEDKALVEFVLPATSGGISSLSLHLTLTGTNSLYLRKYIDSDLAIAYTPTNGVFVLDSVDGIEVGDVFTCDYSDYSGVTFTVESVNEDNLYVVLIPSQTVAYSGAVSGVTITRESDSATFNVSNITGSVPSSYTDSFAFSGFGEWELVTADSDGTIEIEYPEKYMDFDKVSLLVDGSGTIADIYATVEYTGEKQCSIYEPRSNEPLRGVWETILTDAFSGTDTPTSAVGSISATNGSYGWNGIKLYNGSSLGREIPAYYLTEYNTPYILHLKSGDSVSYSISDFVHSVGEPLARFKIRITARYAPEDNLDVAAESFTITQDSFDFARLGIKTSLSSTANSGRYFTNEVYVPASFVEINQDLYIDMGAEDSLTLEAIDNDIEILMVQVWKINSIQG